MSLRAAALVLALLGAAAPIGSQETPAPPALSRTPPHGAQAAPWGPRTPPHGAQAAPWGPRMVVLVRHAERAAEPKDDPGLTEAGAARARALAAALADAGVTAIITSDRRRTRDTAAPLAAARAIAPEIVAAGGNAHAEAVAAAVRTHRDGAVLVVGHSNTVPAIIAALGGPQMPNLCDGAYADLFILTPRTAGASLVRSKYGAPDPPGAAECR